MLELKKNTKIFLFFELALAPSFRAVAFHCLAILIIYTTEKDRGGKRNTSSSEGTKQTDFLLISGRPQQHTATKIITLRPVPGIKEIAATGGDVHSSNVNGRRLPVKLWP